MNKKVLLGMSGGVDSSVSAILLKNQGYEVIGVTLQLFQMATDQTSQDAKKVCDKLGIAHYTYDVTECFKHKVIDHFITCYAQCKTPNPCIECNRYIKFGWLYEKAKELGCDYIATGHYAKIEYHSKYEKWMIKKSNAGKKEQSYVLWNVPQEIIEHVIFPLSDFEDKEQIREIARKNGLEVAEKPDSEDICFIPDGDYKKFLEKNSHLKSKEGNIVLKTGEVLGKHKGLYYYTIGQRRGLGIAYRVPLFVIGFHPEKNEVIVGEEKDLYRKELDIDCTNWFCMNQMQKEINCEAKIRYASKPARCTVYFLDGQCAKVIFEEPQRGITPGQSAVFYDGDFVIGGGKIKA